VLAPLFSKTKNKTKANKLIRHWVYPFEALQEFGMTKKKKKNREEKSLE